MSNRTAIALHRLFFTKHPTFCMHIIKRRLVPNHLHALRHFSNAQHLYQAKANEASSHETASKNEQQQNSETDDKNTTNSLKLQSEVTDLAPNDVAEAAINIINDELQIYNPDNRLTSRPLAPADVVEVPEGISDLQKDVQHKAPLPKTHWMDNRTPQDLSPWLDKVRGPDMARHQAEVASHMVLYFDQIPPNQRNKHSFRAAVGTYIRSDKRRANHVDFIQAALRRMSEFGVNEDIQCYKDLMDTFPKNRFIAQNMWQVEFLHYPRQQDCGVDILQQMEFNVVQPDVEMYYLILHSFGDRSFVMRKYKRMKYWLPKFLHANPHALPRPMPESDIDLARICLKRMCPDPRREIFVHFTSELGERYPARRESTWISYLTSPAQAALIDRHPVGKPIFVEGEYLLWARQRQLKWFQLRADPDVPMSERSTHEPWYERPTDLKFSHPYTQEYPVDLIPKPTVHEQEDGTTLSLCMTGDSSRESLIAWIKFLQQRCPKLAHIPVVFRTRKVIQDNPIAVIDAGRIRQPKLLPLQPQQQQQQHDQPD